jgi:N-hydroxyarylamine O-acetyltransferase
VTRLAARPVLRDGALAPEFAHLTLLVDTGRRWLVDVGFGFPFAIEPLDIDTRDEQLRGGRRFAVTADGDAFIARQIGADPPLGYRFELRAMQREAFVDRCRVISSDPDSWLVRFGPVLRLFDDGWVRLTREQLSGRRGETVLDRAIADEADWHTHLDQHFGLVVRGRTVASRATGGRLAPK